MNLDVIYATAAQATFIKVFLLNLESLWMQQFLPHLVECSRTFQLSRFLIEIEIKRFKKEL